MRASTVALALVLSGCSFVMTERPKPPPHDPDCSRSYAPVVLDILGALTWPGVAGVLYLTASSDDISDFDDNAGTLATIIIGTFVAEVVSAGVGISRVGDCKDAYRARAPDPYPPYYGPQPVPPRPSEPPPPVPPRPSEPPQPVPPPP